MTTDDEQLQDPVVLRALRRLGALDEPGRVLCPRCGRRDLPDGADWCEPCQADDAAQRRASKRDWWARQGNYRELRVDLGPREAAARWIAHQLRRGPLEVAEIRTAAHRAGIPHRTLRRAREQLQDAGRLVVERRGLAPGRVRWRLTTTEERRTDGHVAIGSPSDRADSARGAAGLARPDTADHDEEHDR